MDKRPVIIPMWAVQEVFDQAQAGLMRMPERNPKRRSAVAAAFNVFRECVKVTEEQIVFRDEDGEPVAILDTSRL